MPQQLLNLVSPSTILSTLPALASAKIDMINPSLLAPDSSSGARSVSAGIANTNNNRGPLGQAFDALQGMMMKKMDPEAQARQKLLEAQAKRAELESSPEAIEMEKQKRQLEMMNVQDEMQGRQMTRDMMKEQFGAGQNQLKITNDQKQAELDLRRQELDLRAKSAQSEEERNQIKLESDKLDLDQKKVDAEAAKQVIPSLAQPGMTGKIPEIGAQQDGASQRASLIKKKAMLDRIAPRNPAAAAESALIADELSRSEISRKTAADQNKEVFGEEMKQHQKDRVNYDTALAKLTNLEKLNKTGSTGMENRFIPGKFEGDDERQFSAAAIEYAKSLRKAGEGAMSDKDVELLMRSAPNVGNSQEVNQAIIDRIRAELTTAKAKQTYMDQAIRSGKSPTKAAEEFDMMASQSPAPAQSAVPTVDPATPKVTSKEEHAALPPGAKYIGPDGKVATKK